MRPPGYDGLDPISLSVSLLRPRRSRRTAPCCRRMRACAAAGDVTMAPGGARQWTTTAAFLGVTALLVNLKPSEDFLTPFFAGDKGLTPAQIADDVYPLFTYSYLLCLPPVLVAAEYCQRPKQVIVFGLMAREATRFLLIFGSGLLVMQLTQFTFGLAMAANVAMFGFVYKVVPVEKYHVMTGYIKSSTLAGHVLAGALGQFLLSTHRADIITLMWISQACVSAGAIVFVVFVTSRPCTRSGGASFNASACLDLYKNGDVRRWSCCYWIAYAIAELLLTYSTPLFMVVDDAVDLNGVVASAARLAGAVGALVSTAPPIRLALGRFPVLFIVSSTGIVSACLVLMANASNVYLCYALSVLAYAILVMLITFGSAEIATRLPSDFYVALFCMTAFVSLCVQSVCQVALQLFPAVRKKFLVLAAVASLAVGGAFLSPASSAAHTRTDERPDTQESPLLASLPNQSV
ncbi:unnamed protein product (mitochondrion) [Plasmodiophora brassicae]|uniref:Major facilitator superfamily (MFS) profile domain-containing protein n=1 Tax=Plasmodiophora brassicae TaxID=37360 RepID=A0A3P3Y6V8_PLABS|nr:unnamed protein product [Plasmodiophora brassicae]